MPGESEYDIQNEDYFNVEQTDLHPDCRVAPLEPEEVSTILQIATQHDCQFAVKSGMQ
jgi:hypothetical protein